MAETMCQLKLFSNALLMKRLFFDENNLAVFEIWTVGLTFKAFEDVPLDFRILVVILQTI